MEHLEEVIMAVEQTRNKKLGCCYYSAGVECLFFLEDMSFSNIETIDKPLQVRTYIAPTTILVSWRVGDEVLNLLDPNRQHREDGEYLSYEPFKLPYALELRPAAEFGYEIGKQKLANLELELNATMGRSNALLSLPGDTGEDGWADCDSHSGQRAQILRLSGLITVESKVTIGCAGAVIAYLQRRRAANFLPHDEEAQAFFCVSSVSMFTLKDTMFISQDTMTALQIFNPRPVRFAGKNRTPKASLEDKDFSSVFGLFENHTYTPQGRTLLRQYFLRPSLNAEVLNERLKAVDMFLRPSNGGTTSSIAKCLKKIKDARSLMSRLRRGVCGGTGRGGSIAYSIWSGLQKFAFHAIALRQQFSELNAGQGLELHEKIASKFEVYRLTLLGSTISNVIDFQNSRLEHRTVVKRGLDRSLDEKKRFYAGMQDLLSKVAHEIAAHTNFSCEQSGDLNVIFFPQIGFLIAVPLDRGTGEPSARPQVDQVWEKSFTTEAHAYYKSPEMNEMDERYGDIYGEICDREIEIIHELAQRVLEYEILLTAVSDICGEVDSLLALAQVANSQKFCRPIISEANLIRIKGSRHPLQELITSSFVPNDVFVVGGSGTDELGNVSGSPVSPRYARLGGGTNATSVKDTSGPSMVVLTGPNFSGKSVYLKQVTLAVYLCHIGSFVPAETAEIGITDKILTRINTCESASSIQSAFMVELQQISMAINIATNRSLLVIDEFGKGTRSSDGIGLAAGVFKYLLDQGSKSPKVFAATHFHELFENGYLEPHPGLWPAHMEIQLLEAVKVQDQITYLYNLRPGHSSQSFGTLCAALNGIPDDIIQMAEKIVVKAAKGGDLAELLDSSENGDDEVSIRETERIARQFFMDDLVEDSRSLLARIL